MVVVTVGNSISHCVMAYRSNVITVRSESNYLFVRPSFKLVRYQSVLHVNMHTASEEGPVETQHLDIGNSNLGFLICSQGAC